MKSFKINYTLSEEQLQKIPADLIEKLQEATLLLDKEQCLQVAGMISDHNHELGKQLRRMVEELQYKQILTILDNLTEAKPR